jgi:hypothetical protein
MGLAAGRRVDLAPGLALLGVTLVIIVPHIEI